MLAPSDHKNPPTPMCAKHCRTVAVRRRDVRMGRLRVRTSFPLFWPNSFSNISEAHEDTLFANMHALHFRKHVCAEPASPKSKQTKHPLCSVVAWFRAGVAKACKFTSVGPNVPWAWPGAPRAAGHTNPSGPGFGNSARSALELRLDNRNFLSAEASKVLLRCAGKLQRGTP